MHEPLTDAGWHSTVWLLIAAWVSVTGSFLVLRGGPPAGGREKRRSGAGPAVQEYAFPWGWRTGILAITAPTVFIACFEASCPYLGLHVPVPLLLTGWSMQAGTATLAMLIAARGARTIRNVALSGAILAGGTSCMLFTIISSLAAPAPLGYDIRIILLAMASGGTLAAVGFWRAGEDLEAEVPGGWQPCLIAAAFIAESLVMVTGGSLGSILAFATDAQDTPATQAAAFEALVVLFLSEAAVTVGFGLIGAALDHWSARLIMRERQRLRELTESTFEGLVIHRDGIVLDANHVFCNLVGKRLAAIEGEPFAKFLDAGSAIAPFEPFLTEASATPPGKPDGSHSHPAGEHFVIGGDGHHLPVEVLSRAIAFAGGPAVVTALRDISERQAAEAKIRFLAHHDMLTGLPNRAQLHDVIAWHLAQANQSGQSVAVLCLDLDRFKAVNDTFGHQAGDTLLRQVAERLLNCIRPVDAAARIGGDEFVLLVAAITRPDSIAELSRRLIDTLAQPFDLGGFEARIGTSIGIAVGPRDGITAEELMKNADIALYRSKANGRGGFCFFESGMDQIQQDRRALEQDLRQAMAEQAFELKFQPQFACVSRQVVSFEALVRWTHPVRGPMPPDEFIPIAEATGLIVPLGRWVLHTACSAAQSWALPCVVAVNVSPRQFIGEDFADTVEDILEATGLPPNRLELEITETVMIHEAERALDSLLRLKALGVSLALDDFGTGFSSLSNLQRFPFDKVKIDKSFIHDLIERESAQAIVGAILAMSHQLNLIVTAEGVETEAQFAMLRQQRCDLIQGYLLSRPIAMDLVPAFLAAQAAASPELGRPPGSSLPPPFWSNDTRGSVASLRLV